MDQIWIGSTGDPNSSSQIQIGSIIGFSCPIPQNWMHSLLSYQKMFWGLSSTKSLFDSCGKNRIPPQFFNDIIIAKKKINLHSTIHEICCTDYFIIYVYEVLSNNWCMHVYLMVYTARTTIKNNILKLAVNDVIVAQRGNRPRLRSFLWFSPFWRSVVQ